MYLSSNWLAVIVIALERSLHEHSVTSHTPSKQASRSLNQAIMFSAPSAGGKPEKESGQAGNAGFWSLLIWEIGLKRQLEVLETDDDDIRSPCTFW